MKRSHHSPVRCVFSRLASALESTERWLPPGKDEAADLLRDACCAHASMAVLKDREEYQAAGWTQRHHLARIGVLLETLQWRVDVLEKRGIIRRDLTKP